MRARCSERLTRSFSCTAVAVRTARCPTETGMDALRHPAVANATSGNADYGGVTEQDCAGINQDPGAHARQAVIIPRMTEGLID